MHRERCEGASTARGAEVDGARGQWHLFAMAGSELFGAVVNVPALQAVEKRARGGSKGNAKAAPSKGGVGSGLGVWDSNRADGSGMHAVWLWDSGFWSLAN